MEKADSMKKDEFPKLPLHFNKNFFILRILDFGVLNLSYNKTVQLS